MSQTSSFEECCLNFLSCKSAKTSIDSPSNQIAEPMNKKGRYVVRPKFHKGKDMTNANTPCPKNILSLPLMALDVMLFE